MSGDQNYILYLNVFHFYNVIVNKTSVAAVDNYLSALLSIRAVSSYTDVRHSA